MLIRKAVCTFALTAALLSGRSAMAETTLRIAMTASDIPTTTGHAQQRLRGHALPRLPDLRRAGAVGSDPTDQLATLRPGLAEKWEQDADDNKTWIFHLRHGVKFHDGTDFNADAVIWNLDRYLQQGEPAIRAAELGDVARARAGDGQLQEDRRLHRRDHDHDAGLLLPLYGGLSAVHLAGLVREGRARTGPRSRPCRRPAPVRSGSPRSCRGRRPIWRAATTTGMPARKAKVDKVVLMPIPEANTRLAALRSGQVDWIEVPPPDGIALAEAGGLRHHHRLLSACLAVVLQHRRDQQPVQGRPRAPGAELLHRPRRAGRRCSTARPSRRSAG